MFVASYSRTMASAKPKIEAAEEWVSIEEIRRRKREEERCRREAMIERGRMIAAAEREREQRILRAPERSKTFMSKWRMRQQTHENLDHNSIVAIETARTMARGVLSDPKATTIQRIEARAIIVFGVTKAEIRGVNRFDRIVFARFFICYWSRRLTSLSLPQIGRVLGGKDHTTVLNGMKSYRKRRAQMGRALREVR